VIASEVRRALEWVSYFQDVVVAWEAVLDPLKPAAALCSIS
jgi:hypothetical protein